METVTLMRTIQAEPQAVFAAFTTPDGLARWFAPTAELEVIAECELVPGGTWRVEMQHQDGDVFAVGGAIRSSDPPRFLEWSWRWEGEALASLGDTRVVVAIDREAGGSRLRVSHDGFPNEEFAGTHRDGWESSLSRLADLFAPKSPHRISTLLALHRQLFTQTMDGVSDVDLLRQPNDMTPSMLWIACQIARGRYVLATKLGLDVTFPFPAFAKTAPNYDDYPSWHEVLAYFSEVTHTVYGVLHQMDTAALRRPHGMDLPINDPTMAGLLDHAVDEEAYLLGQLSFMRMLVGYEAPNGTT